MEKPMQEAQQQQGPSVETPAEKKRVPGWLAATGAGAFLLCAGAFIFWFLGGSFTGTSDLIPDPTRADRGGGRGNWRQMNADGVKAYPNNQGHYVQAGQAFMDVIPPQQGSKKQDVRYRFRYDTQALLTTEQMHLIRGVRQIDAWAKAMAVTPSQLDQLRKFGSIQMALSQADQDRVIAAWTEYDKAAAKGDPEKKLVAALKDAGTKALPATKTLATARIAEISRLLTPEQVRELTKLGAGEKVTPITPRGATTAPAARGLLATTRPTTRRATTRPI